MTQLPFTVGPMRVLDDLGPLGQGASQARYVVAENGLEYIIKGAALTPDHPYVASNELVAAMLARTLGLPVLDFAVVRLGDDLYFASTYMPPGTFYPQIRQDLFDTCENRDRVYLLLAFDIWICNVDRHDQNLLVRVVRPRGGGERHLLLLNDHGHCLVQPSQTPASLAGALEALPAQYIRLPFLSGAVTDIAAFRQAVAAIEALEESVLRGLVRSIPTRLLSEADGRVLEEFLLNRRSRLRTVLNSGRTVFPNLQGGDL